MKGRRLAWLGGLVFVAAALWQAPAALLYGWFAPATAQLKLFGISGTIWSGSASGASLGSQRLASDLRWSLHPLRLLRLQASFDISSQGEGLTSQGRVTLSPGGLRFDELRASGPLKPVLALVGQAYLPVDGQLGLNLQVLRLRQGVPLEIAGNGRIQGLKYSLGRQSSPLGDYIVDASPQGDVQAFTVRSENAVLQASGGGQIDADHNYNIDITLKPAAGADRAMLNLLSTFGAADGQGSYHIRRSGQLTPEEPAADPDAQAADAEDRS
jgi:hypothetical protein